VTTRVTNLPDERPRAGIRLAGGGPVASRNILPDKNYVGLGACVTMQATQRSLLQDTHSIRIVDAQEQSMSRALHALVQILGVCFGDDMEYLGAYVQQTSGSTLTEHPPDGPKLPASELRHQTAVALLRTGLVDDRLLGELRDIANSRVETKPITRHLSILMADLGIETLPPAGAPFIHIPPSRWEFLWWIAPMVGLLAAAATNLQHLSLWWCLALIPVGLLGLLLGTATSASEPRRGYWTYKLEQWRHKLYRSKPKTVLESAIDLMDHIYGTIGSRRQFVVSITFSTIFVLLALLALRNLIWDAVSDTTWWNQATSEVPIALIVLAWACVNIITDLASLVCTRGLMRYASKNPSMTRLGILMLVDIAILSCFAVIPTGVVASALGYYFVEDQVGLYRALFFDYIAVAMSLGELPDPAIGTSIQIVVGSTALTACLPTLFNLSVLAAAVVAQFRNGEAFRVLSRLLVGFGQNDQSIHRRFTSLLVVVLVSLFAVTAFIPTLHPDAQLQALARGFEDNLIEDACEKGVGEACSRSDHIPTLAEACDLGSGSSCLTLARSLANVSSRRSLSTVGRQSNHRNPKVDWIKVGDLVRRGCELASPAACVELAQGQLVGTPWVERDYEEGHHNAHLACGSGRCEALYAWTQLEWRRTAPDISSLWQALVDACIKGVGAACRDLTELGVRSSERTSRVKESAALFVAQCVTESFEPDQLSCRSRLRDLAALGTLPVEPRHALDDLVGQSSGIIEAERQFISLNYSEIFAQWSAVSETGVSEGSNVESFLFNNDRPWRWRLSGYSGLSKFFTHRHIPKWLDECGNGSYRGCALIGDALRHDIIEESPLLSKAVTLYAQTTCGDNVWEQQLDGLAELVDAQASGDHRRLRDAQRHLDQCLQIRNSYSEHWPLEVAPLTRETRSCNGGVDSACRNLDRLLEEDRAMFTRRLDSEVLETACRLGRQKGRFDMCLRVGRSWIGSTYSLKHEKGVELLHSLCMDGVHDGCRALIFAYMNTKSPIYDPIAATALLEERCREASSDYCDWHRAVAFEQSTDATQPNGPGGLAFGKFCDGVTREDEHQIIGACARWAHSTLASTAPPESSVSMAVDVLSRVLLYWSVPSGLYRGAEDVAARLVDRCKVGHMRACSVAAFYVGRGMRKMSDRHSRRIRWESLESLCTSNYFPGCLAQGLMLAESGQMSREMTPAAWATRLASIASSSPSTDANAERPGQLNIYPVPRSVRQLVISLGRERRSNENGAAVLRALCDEGFAMACLQLGIQLSTTGHAQSMVEAATLLSSSCSGGGCDQALAKLPLKQELWPVLEPTLEAYCDQGNGAVCAKLGRYLRKYASHTDGAGRAGFYLSRACALDQLGCTAVGELIVEGLIPVEGGEQARTEAALAMFHSGCERQTPRACRYLATAYESGNGVSVDIERAQMLRAYACFLKPDASQCVGAEHR